jgi:hypothetical protein
MACAAWAVVVPYVADALGLELDVAASTEVIDHVVPGVLAAGLGAVLFGDARRAGQLPWLLAAGAAFLTGFWITATHVPLLLEAADGASPWGASLVHLSAGPPVALVAGRMLLLRG